MRQERLRGFIFFFYFTIVFEISFVLAYIQRSARVQSPSVKGVSSPGHGRNNLGWKQKGSSYPEVCEWWVEMPFKFLLPDLERFSLLKVLHLESTSLLFFDLVGQMDKLPGGRIWWREGARSGPLKHRIHCSICTPKIFLKVVVAKAGLNGLKAPHPNKNLAYLIVSKANHDRANVLCNSQNFVPFNLAVLVQVDNIERH